MRDHTKLQANREPHRSNVHNARLDLLIAMVRLDDRISEILAKYAGAPCCSMCGALHGERGFQSLLDKAERQRAWLIVLDSKLKREEDFSDV